MVFTDPPYNVPIDGHATGLGAIHHRSFAMAAGEMSQPAFTIFLARSLRNQAAYCLGGALLYVCMDWRHMAELLAAGREVDAKLQNLCVWVKDNPGMGSLYRSQHELVFVFKTGDGPHRNNVQLGRFGRNRSNVWRYAGVNSFSRKTEEGNLLALHPTVKPVALVSDAILDCTARLTRLDETHSNGSTEDKRWDPSVEAAGLDQASAIPASSTGAGRPGHSCELESAAKPIGFIHLLYRLSHPSLGHQSWTVRAPEARRIVTLNNHRANRRVSSAVKITGSCHSHTTSAGSENQM